MNSASKIKVWAKAAAIRALRTFAQSALGVIGAAAMITEVNWPVVFSSAALAAVLSILTSIATTLPEVEAECKEEHRHE